MIFNKSVGVLAENQNLLKSFQKVLRNPNESWQSLNES